MHSRMRMHILAYAHEEPGSPCTPIQPQQYIKIGVEEVHCAVVLLNGCQARRDSLKAFYAIVILPSNIVQSKRLCLFL